MFAQYFAVLIFHPDGPPWNHDSASQLVREGQNPARVGTIPGMRAPIPCERPVGSSCRRKLQRQQLGAVAANGRWSHQRTFAGRAGPASLHPAGARKGAVQCIIILPRRKYIKSAAGQNKWIPIFGQSYCCSPLKPYGPSGGHGRRALPNCAPPRPGQGMPMDMNIYSMEMPGFAQCSKVFCVFRHRGNAPFFYKNALFPQGFFGIPDFCCRSSFLLDMNTLFPI